MLKKNQTEILELKKNQQKTSPTKKRSSRRTNTKWGGGEDKQWHLQQNKESVR